MAASKPSIENHIGHRESFLIVVDILDLFKLNFQFGKSILTKLGPQRAHIWTSSGYISLGNLDGQPGWTGVTWMDLHNLDGQLGQTWATLMHNLNGPRGT